MHTALTLTTLLFLVTATIAVLWHAAIEFTHGLAEYLGDRLDFVAPRQMKNVLFLLAVANLLIPLVIGVFGRSLLVQAFLFSYAAGAFLGDTFSTHLIPTWLTHKTSPATGTAPLYIALAFWSGIMANEIIWLGLIAGALSFVALWPGLLALKKTGLFAYLQKNDARVHDPQVRFPNL